MSTTLDAQLSRNRRKCRGNLACAKVTIKCNVWWWCRWNYRVTCCFCRRSGSALMIPVGIACASAKVAFLACWHRCCVSVPPQCGR